MSNALKNYINQRIHPGLMLSLSVFIMLYSVPVSSLNGYSIVAFFFIFFMLSCFRLYDDLMQADHDIGKPNRDYTDPAIRKVLFYYVLALLFIVITIVLFVNVQIGLLLLGFSVINHILYVTFVKNKIAAGLLPLLKYPFIFLLFQFWNSALHIDALQILQAVALYTSFVAFESIEDETFVISRTYSYILQVTSFVLILLGSMNRAIVFVCIGFVFLSVVFNYLKWKYAPYIFLLFILAFKIIQYEIST